MQMYIKGAAMTRFEVSYKSTAQLAYQAACDALDDSDLSIKDIDAVVVSNIDISTNGERQRHFPAVLSSLFKQNLPIMRIVAACAGGGAALYTANKLDFENILVIGAEKITSGPTPVLTDELMMATERVWEQTEGMIFPAQNALIAQRYFNTYIDTTLDDFALIALKNHQNGALNPKARFYKKQVTLDQIKASPVIASPLRLYDCSVNCDGAAAVVVSKEKTDVKVAGSSLMCDSIAPFERKNMASFKATKLAAENAYNQAGITPADIDIAELHDAFTIVELISYEDLGFCKPGESAIDIRQERFNIDGKLPVNTSGGLKSRGHPISATGLAQVVELVEQLRGLSGERQVGNLNYALAQNVGGVGSTVTVNILKKV